MSSSLSKTSTTETVGVQSAHRFGASRGSSPRDAKARGRKTTRRSSPLFRAGPPILVLVVIFAVWQTVSMAGLVPSSTLPAPTMIVEQGWANREVIWSHALPTIIATLVGFSVSAVLAFVISIVIDFSLTLRYAIMPLLVISQTLPIVAIAPLIIMWFGFGLFPKVVLVSLVTFFPMTVSFLQGYASADGDAQRLVGSLGGGRATIFRLVRLPSAIPSIFAGLRISIAYAVVGAIFAEYAGAVSGLGVFMQSSKSLFRTDLVLAAVAISSILTLILFGIVALIERLTTPWLRIQSKGKNTP